MYIVIYNDCTLMPVINNPAPVCFQTDARCFMVDGETTLYEISVWYGQGNKPNDKFVQVW